MKEEPKKEIGNKSRNKIKKKTKTAWRQTTRRRESTIT
jgi:hypothetical protein